MSKEDDITEIIDAVIRINAVFKKHSLNGIKKITVDTKLKKHLDYLFYDVNSFYVGKESIYAPLKSICGIDIGETY